MRRVALAGCLAVIVAMAGTPARGAAPRTFQIDPARSRFVIDVGKAGLLSFAAGHAHEVETRAIEGSIQFDPQAPLASTVRIQIDSASLRVTGKGEPPEDVPKVQEIMLSERVLDVRRHPAIVWQSTAVARATAADTYSVTGRLTLRGRTLSLAVPVKVEVAGDTLTATGRSTIKQTDYGITPVSVAGVVKVKDELEISFTVVGTARN